MATLRALLSMCCQEPGGRIVSSRELTVHQVDDARLHDRFYVDDHGFGFAFVPWTLRLARDPSYGSPR